MVRELQKDQDMNLSDKRGNFDKFETNFSATPHQKVLNVSCASFTN